MPDSDYFDLLVSGLPLDERQNLLEKFQGLSSMPLEPLYLEDDLPEIRLSNNEQFFRMPWFVRIWYYILGFFKSSPPQKLVEDRRISLLGQKINERTPGLFNYKTGRLSPVFYSLLQKLKTASRFFYSALEIGFKKDRGAFFAYLGSLEMAGAHNKLENAVNPEYFAERNPGAAELEIRQFMLHAVDDAIREIDDESRSAMYFDSRVLYCLRLLAAFPFDRIIMAFSFDLGLAGYACFLHSIKDLLHSLNNILYSFKSNPPMTLLSSLFVFVLREKADEPDFDINDEMRRLLSKAEDAIAVIREFNKRAPLTQILNCSRGSASIQPHEISGGEDWNAVYRDFWRREAEMRFAEYTGKRRKQELLSSYLAFFGGTDLRPIENAASESNSGGFPLENAYSLSFLLTFYSDVFMVKINKSLKYILVEGEFSKKENRMEFNESYNVLVRLEELILKLDSQISEYGSYGKRYAHARQEMSALTVKRRRIQLITSEASEKAAEILVDARRACAGMAMILSGILGRESKGRYFPLLNLARLREKHGWFINGVSDAIEIFRKALEILDNIDELEAQGAD